MQNIGTIYSSTERTPTVLQEMAELLPPLSGEQLAALEADILKNGCYSPVIVNEDMVIVDGHNRQKLCEQSEVDSAAPYCVSAAVSAEPPPEPDLHVSAYPAPSAITITVLEQV